MSKWLAAAAIDLALAAAFCVLKREVSRRGRLFG